MTDSGMLFLVKQKKVGQELADVISDTIVDEIMVLEGGGGSGS
jgi:hypothetical protein